MSITETNEIVTTYIHTCRHWLIFTNYFQNFPCDDEILNGKNTLVFASDNLCNIMEPNGLNGVSFEEVRVFAADNLHYETG